MSKHPPPGAAGVSNATSIVLSAKGAGPKSREMQMDDNNNRRRTMRISVQTLLDHRACKWQVELFKEFLGDRKFILDTPRNIRLASKFGVDVRWAIQELDIQIPDGPLEDSGGNVRWYLNGQYHREDGPAIIWSNGTKEWWLNGKLHREDGPAIIWSNGTKEWYLNGLWRQCRS